jgi:hypothetical protein
VSLIILVATLSIVALLVTFFLTDRSRWRKVLLIVGILGTALSGVQAYNSRQRADHLQGELDTLRQQEEYSNVARYDAFGLLGLVDPGLKETPVFSLKENSPLNEIFGKYVHNEQIEFRFECTPEAVEAYTGAIKLEPKFPFPYYYRGTCNRLNNSDGWQHDLETARTILTITTHIPIHHVNHDEILKIIDGRSNVSMQIHRAP